MQSEDIEKDQYDKINGLTAEVRELAGAVQVSNNINGELVKLLRRVLSGAFWVIVLLVLALLYATLGPDGYKAIRETLPSIPGSDGGNVPHQNESTSFVTPIFPPPDQRARIYLQVVEEPNPTA